MKGRFIPSLLTLSILSAGLTACSDSQQANNSISLHKLSSYQTGIFDGSAAEIVSYAPHSQQFYVVNAHDNSVDILQLKADNQLKKIDSLDINQALLEGEPNSLDTFSDLIAVAIANPDTQENGVIGLYKSTHQGDEFVTSFPAGALPDMVSFSPDGRYLISANEGEPSDDYQIDPEGSVTIVDLSQEPHQVHQLSFDQLALSPKQLRAKGVRLPRVGKGDYPTTFAQDLEPEYIAVTADSKTAFVSLQENNAIAIIDLENAKFSDVFGLGYKNFDVDPNAMDASDKDKSVNIKTWPVYGMYQPDAITTYRHKGKDYILTANEGDGREYEDEASGAFYTDESRVGKLTLSEKLLSFDPNLQDKPALGRLKVATDMGDTNGDGIYEQLFTYGARSFSIYDAKGKQVFDSGNDFERITSEQYGLNFNNDNDENDPDGRSDAKGPEPEAIAVGEVKGTPYAFIGLERIGGVMVYDISNPSDAKYVTYINDRDGRFEADFDALAKTGKTNEIPDLGPESIEFIPEDESPTGKAMIAVANEVSGSTTLYEIR